MTGDYGRPAALQTASVLEGVFENITRNVVQETVNRNETLPPTEAIKITTMAGCSAVKNNYQLVDVSISQLKGKNY